MSAPVCDTIQGENPLVEAVDTQSPPLAADHLHIDHLEQELRVRTEERENFKNRLKQLEGEMAIMKANAEKKADASSSAVASPVIVKSTSVRAELDREENQQLKDMIANLKIVVKDKTATCSRQELQAQALETQVAALKEVTCLTKGMLSIRNTENEKLKEQIDLMQKKIDSERLRNSAVLKKTELASSLNDQLRNEYMSQVNLFGDLKLKYEKKIKILTDEVARLNQLKQPLTNGHDE